MAWSVQNERRNAWRAQTALCGCGHLLSVHRQTQPFTYELSEDKTQLVKVPNPDHQPMHFHCDECDCVVNKA